MQRRKRPGLFNAGLTAVAALSAAVASSSTGRAQLVADGGSIPLSQNSVVFAPGGRPNALHLAVSQAANAIDTTWVGRGSSSSWLNAANWDQVVVPNGSEDVARFGASSGGPIVALNNASIQVSAISFTDPLFAAILGNGTINLAGPAVIFADGGNFDLPEKVYQTFGSTDPTNPRPGNNISVAIVGNDGLTKNGDSHLQIDAPQYYSGLTTIAGGKIITTVGDAAFGNAASGIFLNNGSIQIANADLNTSRPIVVGGGSGVETSEGSIYWVGNGRKADFFGDVTGVGTLHLNGFYGASVGSAVFHGNNTFTGTLHIGGGTVALRDAGAFAGIGTTVLENNSVVANAIINGGTLVLDNSNSITSINRVGDTTPIYMRGSALTFVGGTTPYVEAAGQLKMDGGVNFITAQAGTGGASIGFSGIDRTDPFVGVSNTGSLYFGSGLVFRGTNLGGTPGPNTTNIFINGSSGTLLVQNGVIPFAYGNASYTTSTTPESPDNVLVTYDAITGVKPITSYDPDFSVNNITRNVRITGNVNSGITTVNANALVLAAPSNFVSTISTGMTLSGAGTVHLQSGVVLSANAGNTGTVGNTNTLPGNIISVNLDFGTTTAKIMTPAALTISGAISGSGGLAKLGGRTAVFSGGNTYTGPTYLTGFTRFVGNVWADGFTPNPFGLDTTPIILYGGNASPTNPTTGSFNGTGFGQLGSDSPGTTNFNRNLELRGDRVMLRSFGDGTLLWNGNINMVDPQTMLTFLSSKSTAHMVVNGSILGQGKVIVGSSDTTDALSPTWVDFMNEASFTGGLVLAGGTIGIGNDNALGHYLKDNGTQIIDVYGNVQVSGNTLITPLGGSRTIRNPFIVYGNTLGIGNSGTNAITLAGSIAGRGGDYVINVTSSVPTVISGTLSGGGMVKTGTGTLVLSGDNTLTGVMSVGNGTTQGGVLVVKSPTALGSIVGPTVVDWGTFSGVTSGQQNQIILDGSAGNLNIGNETLYLRGFGAANTGALRNMIGNNTWNGTVRPTPTYRDAGLSTATLVAGGSTIALQTAAIGVDANSTLTLTGGILVDDDPGVKTNTGTTLFLANSIGIRKVGTGTLVVGSQPLASGTQTWNAAINATGSLEIQGGTVQIKSHTGVASISGGRSVVSVASINLSGTVAAPVGKLDLTDNGLIVNYPASSPVGTIRSYLKAAYGTGTAAWTGTGGITSSLADNQLYKDGKITLGYADTAITPFTTLFGHPLDATSIIVRTAYAGDSNLDGKVDVTDLTALALHWTQPVNSVWTGGDFNYDGTVNINDLLLLAMNWQRGVANPLPASSLSAILTSFNLGDVTVPEPAALSLIGLGFTALTRRRRNRRTCQDYQIL